MHYKIILNILLLVLLVSSVTFIETFAISDRTPGNNPDNNPGNNPGNNSGNNPGNNPGNNHDRTPGNNPGNSQGNNQDGTSASTTSDSKKIRSIPKILGVGFYEFGSVDSNLDMSPNFGDYFPYAEHSNSYDYQNYYKSGTYLKAGQYFSINDKVTSVPTYHGEVGKPVQLQIQVSDIESSQHMQTVILYMNIRGEQFKELSESYIVFDRYGPLQIVDTNKIFKDVKVANSFENGWYWAIFDITFAKPMKRSDLIIEVWNESRNTATIKITDALELKNPEQEISTIKLSQSATVEITHNTSSPICKENNSCFSPSNVNLVKGGTVKWINKDNVIHTIDSGIENDNEQDEYGEGTLFERSLMPNHSFEVQLFESGIYPYHCDIHPWATGTVSVYDSEEITLEQKSLPNKSFIVKAVSSTGSIMVEHNHEIVHNYVNEIFVIEGHVEGSHTNKMVELTIIKPDHTITKEHVLTNDYGYYETYLVIDKNWQLGSYNISAKYQEKSLGGISFTFID